ncbi:MAG: putative DNA binding domain-containing protein [Deltaproteobacteria bacterium]|nr:putative DNA binding domain-containing protein [Deltaproteobacteria bacterium]
MLGAELEALLLDLESDRVERKSALSEPDHVRQAICAFSNDMPDHRQPGVIFIGARDDGSCAGLEVSDKLLLDLAAMRDDGLIQPLPSITVQRRSLCGCDMAVVRVQPSSAPPVRFRGRTWIRVGPRRAIATAEEERRLTERRRGRDLPFDLAPVPSAALDDLDLDWFQRTYLPAAVDPDVLSRNDRTVQEQLGGLRFLGPDSKPTVLGLLVLGVDARRFVPGAYVQFLRIAGLELTDPIQDQKEISGSIADQLRRLDEVLESHNSVAMDIGDSSRDVERPEYPLQALQQIARNAVLHRAYDGTNAPVRLTWFQDRIEIQSPGGPFGQVSRENFGQPGITDYRNPHLAEAMKILGYVQRFGVGIAIARRELEKNTNPPLEFEVEPAHVLVRIRRRA